MKIIWHGKQLQSKVTDTLHNRLKVIAELGTAEIKQSLSIGGGERGSGGAGRALNRSRPGQPPHVDSSNLMRSIDNEVIMGAMPVARIGTNVKYGRYLELGTQTSHVIRPKFAKALSWIGSTGERIFAKSVTIPPLAARPFLRPWLDRSRGDIKRILARRWW